MRKHLHRSQIVIHLFMNEASSLPFTEVATRYINKPLPRVPYDGSPLVNTCRKKRNSQARRALMEDDDNEGGNEP
jgi:hypothetical protein